MNGWKIGKIKDLILNNETWQITHLDVALNGNIADELGMKKVFSATRVLIEVRRVHGIGDAVVLNTTKEELLEKLTSVEAATNLEASPTIHAPPSTPSAGTT